MPHPSDRLSRATSATTWAEIDFSALRHNVELLQQQARPASVAAVVKADAYGHGAVAIANAALAAGASRLCVFTVPEAVELRTAGIAAPILCLGPVLADDPEPIAMYDIGAVVDSATTVRRLAEAGQRATRTIRVHINIDSGMQRYGLQPAKAIELAKMAHSAAALELEGVFTHFADAANPQRRPSLDAFRRFQDAADQIGAPLRHAAASAAAFNLPEASLDFVRAGIALYGIDPAPKLSDPAAAQLQPVLSWRTRLLAIRQVANGESVSYGGLWTAERDSRIGVTGVGYADGLARRMSPGGEMLVRGRRAPIRGAICMDTTMIDLTEIPNATVGDVVTILGADRSQSISAWDIARRLDTIPYEILTGVSVRVPRQPINQEG
ncbi:MAG: alanine racemase [Chloroflexota bacterium]|nr:alanine racemase [Chloroflexota bacterium]MDE2895413.1 alanine racemase [Chloroflexota bacterium]